MRPSTYLGKQIPFFYKWRSVKFEFEKLDFPTFISIDGR